MTDAVPAAGGGRATGPDPAPATTARALVFRLGGRELAALSAPGGRIVEIDSWTRIPTAPPYVLGVANAHGKVLSVLDVRAELGLPQPPWSRPLRALVTGGDALRAAVAIEEVLGFESYDPARSDADDAGSDALAGYGLGSIDLAGWRATLIDLPALVDSLRAGTRARTQP